MRKKIGELLVEAGVVTEEQVRVALGRRGAYGGQRLGEVLVAQGLCTPTHIARALSAQHALPFVELPEEIPPDVVGLVSVDFQSEHRIVPFRLELEGRSERIHVAVEDPGDVTLVDELRFQLRKQMRVFVAASDDLDAALARARGEPLDIVEAVALEDEDGAPPPPVAAGAPLDWDFPEAPKPVPKPVPPAPPPAARPPAHRGPASPPPPPPEATDGEAGVDALDDLLGRKASPPARPPPPPPPDSEGDEGRPRVPVVMFGGAAQGSRPSVPLTPTPQFSDEDLSILDDIERISRGEDASLDTEKVKPARMVASLIRLLIRKGVIQEGEFLEELAQK
ncbi:general secretion pathway protein GspE [Corallococcus macrosporus]|uniref:General secretion pathway protein GspE n=1 Tax=Corallococcus macrosporus DSM 14697 TaxID=1189310 RepID=A0A250JYW5_9BACT|nr:general secretion pathway protein GspE [Corallococcus macrosporus]ATB48923.1 general secretion pathway protein GspE [Corallococcus macrosporus DSM 14697]